MTSKTALSLLTFQLVWWFLVPEFWPLWAHLIPFVLVILTALCLLVIVWVDYARAEKYRK